MVIFIQPFGIGLFALLLGYLKFFLVFGCCSHTKWRQQAENCWVDYNVNMYWSPCPFHCCFKCNPPKVGFAYPVFMGFWHYLCLRISVCMSERESKGIYYILLYKANRYFGILEAMSGFCFSSFALVGFYFTKKKFPLQRKQRDSNPCW